MDHGASELDSSLPQPEKPCLIVEDSQPDSVALEDDPESSYRALLARRLSSLQPNARSPVLELISSPLGSRCSHKDSQSESSQAEPVANSSSASKEGSQVINSCPPTNKKRSTREDVDSEADSTTHCSQHNEGTSQFGLMELSQSQDLHSQAMNSEGKNTALQPDGKEFSSRASMNQDNTSVRSEVISTSSSNSLAPSAQQLSVQALLHSQAQQDSEILSSQEDLFDTDKSDTTVDELKKQSLLTSTPSHTLRLLHLSGQGTLVSQSLSQSLVEYIDPTPENPQTPLIVPNSPTGPENGHGADKSVDTSLPPDNETGEKEEQPTETEGISKQQPSFSTPLSQKSPGIVFEPTLSLPSQPEFSHDVFVTTQSQDMSKLSNKKSAAMHHQTQAQQVESAPFTAPFQLTMNSENSGSAQQAAEQIEEDSQATQIEELEGAPHTDMDVCDSVTSGPDQGSKSSQAQMNLVSKSCAKSLTSQSECTTTESFSLLNKPVVHKVTALSLSEQNENVKELKSDCKEDTISCSQRNPNSLAIKPCSMPSQCMISDASDVDVMANLDVQFGVLTEGQSVKSASQVSSSQSDNEHEKGEEAEEEMENGASEMALALSQSQLLSPEPMEEEGDDQGVDSVALMSNSERDSQTLNKDVVQSKTSSSQPITGNISVSTNIHLSHAKGVNSASCRLSQTEKDVGLKDKNLSDSSGDISFGFTLSKEEVLACPAVVATPPPVNQRKQMLKHSTPIETKSFSEKLDMVYNCSPDVAMPAGVSGDIQEEADGKLSLRMKLVTPVEEGSSESFSLQKPALTEEDGSVSGVTAISKAASSPSVFSRVRQVHRQQENDLQSADNSTPARGGLFISPQESTQASSQGCSSLPNSQSEASQEILETPQKKSKQQSEERRGAPVVSEPPTQNRTDAGKKGTSQHTTDSVITSSLSNKLHQRSVSQQINFEAQGLRSPNGGDAPESPSFRRNAGPSHCRHVRTIQEVRTTITRIITDVYYEDGKEVERKVTEETEEPVVDCQVLDRDVSPCRTGSSSMMSGDLADISSVQHSSGGTSSSTFRPEFILPLSRGARSFSPRRGGRHQQRGHRGHRGHRAGSVIAKDRGDSTVGSLAFVPLSPRGRPRKGRSLSRTAPSRGRGAGSLQRLGAHWPPQSSSEEELPPPVPVNLTDVELPSRSDSLRSSLEGGRSAGSSLVGLRVVAKWSSNGYFYSGRIIKDAGEMRYRLRFDDGYECEVIGKDILLCDPIPLETEVTALLQDEYFSIGVVKEHKTEGEELLYSVEREGQRQWYNRNNIILSLEQGNRLREQHSLGPYEPSTPLAKASDISLDNLVEGKRRRRVTSEGQSTPSYTRSPGPGPPGKRKLRTNAEHNTTPAKRGRRGPGARPAQRLGECNTSGSGTDLPTEACDVAETHGPLPQNTSLFMGFVFLLSASSETDRLTNTLVSSDDEDYVQISPYNREYTESQLQAGGGVILPDFNEDQCNAAYQSLLIADQHCRTRKYLLCLASGVPCVSHIWVRDCCKENKLLNYRNYLLPAGVGLNQTIVEWHPRCTPFKSLRVLLLFETPVELWSQLITMGGASSVQHLQRDKDNTDIPVGGYDVVVTDPACSPLVTSPEIPQVSPEWLIKSIIYGKNVGFHTDPLYHDGYTS